MSIIAAAVFCVERLSQTVPLSFTFTFYGHEVKQITIATGGMVFAENKYYTLDAVVYFSV